MTPLPRDVAKRWVDRPVRDVTDAVLGTCAGVLAPGSSRVVEWLEVDLPGGRHSFVPAEGATEVEGTVHVAFTHGAVVAMSTTARTVGLTTQDETRLHEHYGRAARTGIPVVTPTAPPPGAPAVARSGGPVPSAGGVLSRLVPTVVAAVGAGTLVALVAHLLRRTRPHGSPVTATGGRRNSARPAAGASNQAVGVRWNAARTSIGGRATALTTIGTKDRPTRGAGHALAARAFAGGRRAAHLPARLHSAARDALVAPVLTTITTTTAAGRRVMRIIRTAVVFGVGYVVGARAGHQRYEQLASGAGALLQRPEVQQAWQRVRGLVSRKGASIAAQAQDVATDITENAQETAAAQSAPAAGLSDTGAPEVPASGVAPAVTSAGSTDPVLSAPAKVRGAGQGPSKPGTSGTGR